MSDIYDMKAGGCRWYAVGIIRSLSSAQVFLDPSPRVIQVAFFADMRRLDGSVATEHADKKSTSISARSSIHIGFDSGSLLRVHAMLDTFRQHLRDFQPGDAKHVTRLITCTDRPGG